MAAEAETAALQDDYDDLDAELEAVFDTPPSTPPPPLSRRTVVPASPEPERKEPEKKGPRSILEALVANQKRLNLSSHAAKIAADVNALVNAKETEVSNGQTDGQAEAKAGDERRVAGRRDSARLSIEEVMRKRRQRPETEEERKKRARKAKNAFRVIGADRRKLNIGNQPATHEYIDLVVTNMSLRAAIYESMRLEALFEHSTRIDIAEIEKCYDDIKAGNKGEWVLFGCLVKKHSKRESKKGSMFATWSLCNMPRGEVKSLDAVPPSTMVTMLLFDQAFQAYHTQVEGTVFAVRRPNVLPPREVDGAKKDERGSKWSGYCVSVSKKEHVIPLGVCKDYMLCEEPMSSRNACGAWYDANRSKMCTIHEQRKRRAPTRVRMDIHNAERAPSMLKQKEKWKGGTKDISGGGGDAEEEHFDASAALKAKRDVELTNRINNFLGKRSAGSAQSLAEKRRRTNEGIARAVQRDMKRKEAALNKPGGLRSRVQMQSAGLSLSRSTAPVLSQTSSQGEYERAMRVLKRIGFAHTDDGSLIAPRDTKNVRIVKGTRKLRAVLSAHGVSVERENGTSGRQETEGGSKALHGSKGKECPEENARVVNLDTCKRQAAASVEVSKGDENSKAEEKETETNASAAEGGMTKADACERIRSPAPRKATEAMQSGKQSGKQSWKSSCVAKEVEAEPNGASPCTIQSSAEKECEEDVCRRKTKGQQIGGDAEAKMRADGNVGLSQLEQAPVADDADGAMEGRHGNGVAAVGARAVAEQVVAESECGDDGSESICLSEESGSDADE